MILGIIAMAALLIVAVGYKNSSEKTDSFSEFLKRIQDQEVTIEMGDSGAILISYNVNE
jgi:hypothetical protein